MAIPARLSPLLAEFDFARKRLTDMFAHARDLDIEG